MVTTVVLAGGSCNAIYSSYTSNTEDYPGYNEVRRSYWSAEQILRDDASGPDLAYPVAVELEPGKIFAAYYFMEDDGNNFGGTRFIAGTHFLL